MLSALDSGISTGKISLDYIENYLYPAKESSRTFATIKISGRDIAKDEQEKYVYYSINILKKNTSKRGVHFCHSIEKVRIMREKEYHLL